jgi:hypothetical protein
VTTVEGSIEPASPPGLAGRPFGVEYRAHGIDALMEAEPLGTEVTLPISGRLASLGVGPVSRQPESLSFNRPAAIAFSGFRIGSPVTPNDSWNNVMAWSRPVSPRPASMIRFSDGARSLYRLKSVSATISLSVRCSGNATTGFFEERLAGVDIGTFVRAEVDDPQR